MPPYCLHFCFLDISQYYNYLYDRNIVNRNKEKTLIIFPFETHLISLMGMDAGGQKDTKVRLNQR